MELWVLSDFGQLKKVIDRTKEDEDFHSVYLFLDDKSLLSKFPPEAAQPFELETLIETPSLTIDRFVYTCRKLADDGYLVLSFSKGKILSRINRDIIFASVLVIACILITVILGTLIANAISRPIETIAQNLNMEQELVISILDELEKNMTFLFRNNDGAVTWAYPVTVEKTSHYITFSTGEHINAA